MTVRLSELATLVGGTVVGDPERVVEGVSTLDAAGPSELSFVTNPRYRSQAEESAAGALLVAPGERYGERDLLEAEDPYYALAQILAALYPEEPMEEGIHPSAVVAEDAEVAASAAVGAYAVIGARSRVEAGAVIHPQVVIGRDCVVGEGSVLHPHVVLYDRTALGRRVRVHAGTVLGSDGFGFAPHDGTFAKIPHPGRTVVEDDVEIGANTAIDRAMLRETRIGKGTKVDNLVQIGHNCRVGEYCLLVAQVGLSGTVRLGDRVVMAGRSGSVGHVEIGDGTQVAGVSVVTHSLEAGSEVAGFPAQPLREWRRQVVLMRQLDQLFKRVRKLERRLSNGEDGE